AEMRGFLDGSQDALSRLEQWAGQQMGLDLAGSPESVRRFLPLSVIWVTTSRLQRILAQLNSAGRDLSSSQEQIDKTVGALRAAIETTAALATGLTGSAGSVEAANGFSATIAQFSWAPPEAAPARVVESVPVSPSEAGLSPATRAEMERQVREE